MSNLCSLAPLLWGNFSELAETLSGVHYDPAAAAKSHQSCPTLCDLIDGSALDLPCPWDCPGKNTGVGCHFLLQGMKVKRESEAAQ